MLSCPTCGRSAVKAEVFSRSHVCIVRIMHCDLGHSFRSTEVHDSVMGPEHSQIARKADIIKRSIESRALSVQIANELPAGIAKLMEKYGKRHRFIYDRAAKGRKILKEFRDAGLSYGPQ